MSGPIRWLRSLVVSSGVLGQSPVEVPTGVRQLRLGDRFEESADVARVPERVASAICPLSSVKHDVRAEAPKCPRGRVK